MEETTTPSLSSYGKYCGPAVTYGTLNNIWWLYLCNFEVRWESNCDSGSSWNLKEHKIFGYIEW